MNRKLCFKIINSILIISFLSANIAAGAQINNTALRPPMSFSKPADTTPASIQAIPKKPIIETIDETLLEGLDLDEPKTIIIYGGAGSLAERYLKDGFNEVSSLFKKVRFIVLDVVDPNEAKGRMETIGLPWLEGQNYIRVNLDNEQEFGSHVQAVDDKGFLTINGQKVKIDGVITAVPTYLHLRIAQEWAKKGVLVWVEKPLSMISELENVHTLVKTYPRQMYCVDYFMDSDAITWLMAHREVLDSIGKIQSLLGRCVENWRLRNEKRRWLLESSKSGGGLAIDSAVHPLAMIAMVLSKLGPGLNLNEANIDDVVLGRYVDPDTGLEADGADKNLETAFWMKSHVGDIELIIDSGKGLETVYEGIKIIGEHGAIEVFVGTEEYDPYVKVTLNETIEGGPSTTIYRFENGQLGYGRTFLDYLLAMYGCTRSSGASFTERFNATVSSETIIGKAYALHRTRNQEIITHILGQQLNQTASVPLQVAQEMPKTKERTYATDISQPPVDSLQRLVQQRRDGINVNLPIMDPRAILEDFNKANSANYKPEEVVKSAKIQIEIMKWLRQELGLKYMYPAMDLTRFGGLVAAANKKGDVVKEAKASDGTIQYAVKPFMNAKDIYGGGLIVPDDPSIYPSAKLPIEFIEGVKTDKDLKDVPVLVFVEGPYTLIGNIIGIGDISSEEPEGLVFLKDEQLTKWLAYTEEVVKRQIDALHKAGVKAICLLEPSASAGERFLRPRDFEKFALPVINRIARYAKDRGIGVAYHSCGDTTKNFDAFAKFEGVDIVSVDKVEVVALLAKLPENMAVIWGSDAKEISNLQPEDIFNDMRSKVASGIDNGRWCPGTNCQVKSKITLDRLRAFVLGSFPNLPADITLEALLNNSSFRTQM